MPMQVSMLRTPFGHNKAKNELLILAFFSNTEIVKCISSDVAELKKMADHKCPGVPAFVFTPFFRWSMIIIIALLANHMHSFNNVHVILPDKTVANNN